MECWNIGVLVYERILSIFYYIENANFALNQYSITPEPNIPFFHYSAKASLRAQHSIWGEAPNLG